MQGSLSCVLQGGQVMNKLIEFLCGAGYIACICTIIYVTLVVVDNAIGVR